VRFGRAADDIVQEAFAKLHLHHRRVHNPGGWLRTVVVNAARNEVRRHAPGDCCSLGCARSPTSTSRRCRS